MSDNNTKKTAKQVADELYDDGMDCNCDLDSWQPERSTGHTSVCGIHKKAIAIVKEAKP